MDAVGPGDLVRRAREGEETAWFALVDRFAPLVWSVARSHRLGDDDARDVAQTVWLRLVEHLDRLQDPDRVAGWLLVTSRNEALRVLRWSSRTVLEAEPDRRAVDADLTTLEDAERDAALWRCVSQLPSRCHVLVRMLLLDPPPTYDDISEALGMPIGSIGPTRKRCLEQLKADLDTAGITER